MPKKKLNLNAPLTARFLLYSLTIYFCYQFVLCYALAQVHSLSWIEILNRSESYQSPPATGEIEFANVLQKSHGPLYRAIIRLLLIVTLREVDQSYLGAASSLLMFLAFAIITGRILDSKKEDFTTIFPESRLGWLFFLFSPGSFLLLTNHGASLYLLLSFLALKLCCQRRLIAAAVVAGLSSLASLQGLVLGIVVASWAATTGAFWIKGRTRLFFLCGSICLVIFLLWPFYQWLVFQDPLRGFGFTLERGMSDLARYLPPGSLTNWGLALQAVFITIMGLAAWLWFYKNRLISLYVGLSVALIILLGTSHSLRIGTVLFPAMYILGDRVGELPRPTQVPLLVMWLVAHHVLAMNYGLW